jgi:hypothetical protein
MAAWMQSQRCAIGSSLMARLCNHKRVYRIYCALKLNLRIKPRKRLKPDVLALPDAPNITV